MAQLATEARQRQLEALRCYRPTEKQLKFHSSSAAERIIRGGKRCLSGDQEIYDPVAGKRRRIDSIGAVFHVYAVNQKTGQVEIARAEKPFIKGFGDLYRVDLSNGMSFTGTLGHQVLTRYGWRSIQEAQEACLFLPSFRCHESDIRSEPASPERLTRNSRACWQSDAATSSDSHARYLLGGLFAAGRCCREWGRRVFSGVQSLFRYGLQVFGQSVTKSAVPRSTTCATRAQEASALCCAETGDCCGPSQTGYTNDYQPCLHSCGARLHWAAKACQALVLRQNDAHIHNLARLQVGVPGREAAHTLSCLESFLLSIGGCACRVVRQGAESGFRTLSGAAGSLLDWTQLFLQYLLRKALRRRTADAGFLDSGRDSSFISTVNNSVETCPTICSLAQTLFIARGNIWDFSVPGYDNYILSGIVHHNSGKTVAASAEFASAVTGMPILDQHGNPLPRKYPQGDMLCWIIGWDLAHIGQTLYKYLFLPGYFNVLPNGDGTWRTLNRANPADLARWEESEPAGPMIPSRFILPDSWAWENKAEHTFTQVSVKNQWGTVKICAYPSTAIQPKQGDAVDLIWIDEDVRFSQHVSEWQDRLADKKGRLFWSAWPHGTNDALVKMSERATEQVGREHPDIEEVVLRFSDNPFIDTDEKRKSVARMTTEEERRSRDYGEFLFDLITMYEFIPAIHGIYRLNPDDVHYHMRKDDYLNQLYTELGGFPKDWTRYLSVDPSHTRTAVLFGVVPPPEYDGKHLGKMLIIENELIMKKAGAEELAKAVRDVVAGKRYEAFIMDQNMGRQTRVGSTAGNTVMTMYEEAFAAQGVKSRLTQSSFLPGNNIVPSRIMEVRSMLTPDPDGRIQLRFAIDKTYETQKEFGSYRKKMVLDQVLDEPANPRKYDAMSALEYLASYIHNSPDPYVDPSAYRAKNGAFVQAQQLLAKWKSRKEQGEFCHIGPGGG